MEGDGIPNHGGDPVDGRTGISDDSQLSADEDAPSVSTPSDAFTAYPEESNSESPSPSTSSRDALARGISSLLGSVLKDFDLRALQTITSQDNLSSSIDRLTQGQELDRLLEDAPLPFIMQHAARISSVRRRVTSMNTILKSVQRRVDNIDRILSVGSQSHPGEGLEKQFEAVSAGFNVFEDSMSSRSQANDLEGAD